MTARSIPYIILFMLLFITGKTFASDHGACEIHSEKEPRLCSHEPTTVGYTKDNDDVGFMDFKVSLKYQMFPDWLTRLENCFFDGWGDSTALYFAFTGRFGQYIGTRDSSPVVEKRFNPMMMYRIFYGEEHKNHVDLVYAHESNGQSIDSLAEYQAALANTNDRTAIKDQISRGWDYVELSWKQSLPDLLSSRKSTEESENKKRRDVVGYLTLKQFMRNGMLQGAQENYNDWENDAQGKRRDRVDGIAAMIKWTENSDGDCFKDLKVVVQFATGMRQSLRYNTWRGELGTKLFQLPIAIWYQTGYNSDLAQYYKKVNSRGIQVEIGSF